MAGFWVGGDDSGGVRNYYGANGRNVASIINGKLYVYDPANFNASDPDVQSVVSQAQPQIATPLEVAQIQDPHGPGVNEGGSDIANLLKGVAFIGGGYGLTNLLGGAAAGAGAGAGTGGAATDSVLNTAINAGSAGSGYAVPSYEAAAGLTEGATGAATGAGAAGLGIDPGVAKMLAQLGITGLGGAGGVGGGGVPSNLLSLLGPALGIGGGIAALTGSGQLPTNAGQPGGAGYTPSGLPQVDSTLQQLLQAVYSQSADPQQALYNRTLQQGLDTGRSGQALRGLGVSPVGQQLENQQTNNFNMDWQNQQLARTLSAIPGLQQYINTGAQTGAANARTNLEAANFNSGQQRQGVAGLSTGLNQLSTLSNVPGSWLNTLFSGGGGGGGTGGAPVGGSNDVNAYPTFSY